ncbi:MAG: Respiratory nitrate reductase, gamma subunit, partial [Veillonella sp. DORA_A_3_16_22]
MHSCLILSCLLQMDWRTVHDESIPWGALPYIAFTFLIVGTLVRFFYFERNWTTKSSEFLEKKQLRIANPLFHFGLLCVIGG